MCEPLALTNVTLQSYSRWSKGKLRLDVLCKLERLRILSKRELRQLVLYSPAHIARLEAAGAFPQRVKLGQCRVGWIEGEILEWLQERIRRREELNDKLP